MHPLERGVTDPLSNLTKTNSGQPTKSSSANSAALATARMSRVQDPVIPQVRRLIEQNPGTISLGQGVVHYAPPQRIVAELLDSLSSQPDIHKYGYVSGNADVLELLAAKLRQENRIAANPHQILFTAGSNLAFLHAILAVADVGDEVILPSPYFFNHEMAIVIAGCKPICVPCKPDYQLDLAAVRSAITSNTRAIVTVSPNNPTGAMYSQQDLDAVNKLCEEYDAFHISDEAYEYFGFDKAHYSPASRVQSNEHTISLFTLSKAYGMAGWRAGYMHVPEALVLPIQKIQDTSLVAPPQLTQIASRIALEEGRAWCQNRIEPLSGIRDAILEEIKELEPVCHVPKPEGAFYMLMRIDTELPSMTLVEKLVREHSVAVLPGDTFGSESTSLRIAYAALEKDPILEAIKRIKVGLKSILRI